MTSLAETIWPTRITLAWLSDASGGRCEILETPGPARPA